MKKVNKLLFSLVMGAALMGGHLEPIQTVGS